MLNFGSFFIKADTGAPTEWFFNDQYINMSKSSTSAYAVYVYVYAKQDFTFQTVMTTSNSYVPQFGWSSGHVISGHFSNVIANSAGTYTTNAIAGRTYIFLISCPPGGSNQTITSKLTYGVYSATRNDYVEIWNGYSAWVNSSWPTTYT